MPGRVAGAGSALTGEGPVAFVGRIVVSAVSVTRNATVRDEVVTRQDLASQVRMLGDAGVDDGHRHAGTGAGRPRSRGVDALLGVQAPLTVPVLVVRGGRRCSGANLLAGLLVDRHVDDRFDGRHLGVALNLRHEGLGGLLVETLGDLDRHRVIGSSQGSRHTGTTCLGGMIDDFSQGRRARPHGGTGTSRTRHTLSGSRVVLEMDDEAAGGLRGCGSAQR